MVTAHVRTVRYPLSHMSYHDAVDIAKNVRCGGTSETVLLDLAQTTETTTAALARLIVLRRKLRRSGCDLRLLHLHGSARQVYEVNRMGLLLPCEPERPAARSGIS